MTATLRTAAGPPRWEEWARRLAPLIHDGLIDTAQERQIIDKAFYLGRLLDEHLPIEAEASVGLPLTRLQHALAIVLEDYYHERGHDYKHDASQLSLMLMAQGIAAPPSQPTRPPGPRTDERLDCDGSDCSCHGKDTIRDICRHCVRAEARAGLDVEALLAAMWKVLGWPSQPGNTPTRLLNWDLNNPAWQEAAAAIAAAYEGDGA